jgi:D-sedoheptulose 7-phosphate isomerase
MKNCFESGGKLLLCGNGGSCSDCDHMAGEMLKSFTLPRKLNPDKQQALMSIDTKIGGMLAGSLQQAFPVVSLSANIALMTAVANDTDPNLIFAQQVAGYARAGDVLLGISPIGKAANVINALIAAKAFGMKTIGLTGATGGTMIQWCDVTITVPETGVWEAQELHLPVYHALCLMLEQCFFAGACRMEDV